MLNLDSQRKTLVKQMLILIYVMVMNGFIWKYFGTDLC